VTVIGKNVKNRSNNTTGVAIEYGKCNIAHIAVEVHHNERFSN